MKISGQLPNADTSKNYATIKTYIETCRKNGINEVFALTRLDDQQQRKVLRHGCEPPANGI
jgi:hypothetical protein